MKNNLTFVDDDDNTYSLERNGRYFTLYKYHAGFLRSTHSKEKLVTSDLSTCLELLMGDSNNIRTIVVNGIKLLGDWE